MGILYHEILACWDTEISYVLLNTIQTCPSTHHTHIACKYTVATSVRDQLTSVKTWKQLRA